MCKLLIVEDEKEVLDFLFSVIYRELKDVFKPEDVFGVCDAEAALQLLKNKFFHICMIDLILPGMDGVSLIKWINKTYPMTITIGTTGHLYTFGFSELRRYGVDDLLYKPFKMDLLLWTLKAAAFKSARWEKQINDEVKAY